MDLRKSGKVLRLLKSLYGSYMWTNLQRKIVGNSNLKTVIFSSKKKRWITLKI